MTRRSRSSTRRGHVPPAPIGRALAPLHNTGQTDRVIVRQLANARSGRPVDLVISLVRRSGEMHYLWGPVIRWPRAARLNAAFLLETEGSCCIQLHRSFAGYVAKRKTFGYGTSEQLKHSPVS